jgi:hypothetical protein
MSGTININHFSAASEIASEMYGEQVSNLTVAQAESLLANMKAIDGDVSDGLTVSVGDKTVTMSPAELRQFEAAIQAAGGTVPGQATAQKIGIDIRNGSPMEGIQAEWSNFIQGMADNGVPIDVNALVQQVLREAYLQQTEDLRLYSEKVKFYNEYKKAIRDELQSARKELQKYNAANDADAITPVQEHGFNVDPATGAISATATGQSTCNTKGALADYVKNLEEQLNSVGDDAQLANADLQNVLQKQQQDMQAMSNISKMLADTAMAIIRKIGG